MVAVVVAATVAEAAEAAVTGTRNRRPDSREDSCRFDLVEWLDSDDPIGSRPAQVIASNDSSQSWQ